MPKHTVRPGDCIASIAAQFATTLEALWDHSDNSELRELRGDPFVLQEGDEVHVPDAPTGRLQVQAGKKHVFELEHQRCDFEVTLEFNGKLRTNEAWILRVAGETHEGTTGDDGTVRANIPAHARTGALELPDHGSTFDLALGDLDPLDTPRGVQARLRSLSYYQNKLDGDAGPWTARAIRAFQIDHELPITGEADDATLDRLKAVYGR